MNLRTVLEVCWRELNGKHRETVLRNKGSDQKLKWMREEEARESTSVVFQAYRRPLGTVTKFKYLGRVLTASYDDLPEV